MPGPAGSTSTGSTSTGPAPAAPASPAAAVITGPESSGGPVSQVPAAKPQEQAQLEAWEAILGRIRDSKPALASVYEHAAPLEVTAKRLHLAYRQGTFLAEQADAPDARAILADAAATHFGSDVAIELDLAGRHDEVQSLAAKNAALLAARIEAARDKVRRHPLVAAALEHLGAELREVRLPTDFA